jgi:hypothetical protein
VTEAGGDIQIAIAVRSVIQAVVLDAQIVGIIVQAIDGRTCVKKIRKRPSQIVSREGR